MTFSDINKKDLNKALNRLSPEGRALLMGYHMAISGSETNVVEIVKRSERLSDYGRKAVGFAATGKDLDEEAAGGYTSQAFYQPGIVNMGADGAYVAIVMDSKASLRYSDGCRSSLPGELLAHELIGHGMGDRHGNGIDASIQATNLYLKATGHSYFREDHSPGRHSPGFDRKVARQIPEFLRNKFPFWMQ